MRFNLSHSDGLALYAVTAKREFGVNLARVVSERDNEAIAERHFAPRKADVLRALPAEKLSETFYRGDWDPRAERALNANMEWSLF